jgi:hypothetical protein
LKTNEFINALVEDISVRWPVGRALGIALIIGILISGVILLAGIHLRPGLIHTVGTAGFLFKFCLNLSVAVVASGLLLRIARPGLPTKFWRWLLIVPLLLLILGIFGELSLTPHLTWYSRWIGHTAVYCVTMIPLMAVGPLICLLLALRHSAPTRPGSAGAIAGLVASGIAGTFYALHCPENSPLFVSTWYTIATSIVVLAGYLAGSKVLRW